jgi:Bacterial PH domain
MKTYNAPWGTSLVVTSLLSTLVCFVVAILMFWRGPGWIKGIAVLLLATICGGVLFTIHKYTVTPDAILVHRLFWKTRLLLAGLQSAEVAPRAVRGSLRIFGNGGLFSFSGFFRNKTLSVYRAFVTDLRRTVVLRFPTRTVVVSPLAPEEFVGELRARGYG